MNLAVSNIAWAAADDEAAYAMLRELGVQHLEVAPARFWPDLTKATESDVRAVTEKLKQQGLNVCAFQALLFGKPELQLFGSDNGRALIDYTKLVCRIASWMGARALVFGSPKNRLRGELAGETALHRAIDAFQEIGDYAVDHGVLMCVEPNPKDYGADFLTDVVAAATFVGIANSEGIRLNFDMGEIIMNGEDAGAMIDEHLSLVGHFHISEPMLEPFDAMRPEHAAAARALHAHEHPGMVSVEMKTPASGGLEVVRRSVLKIKEVYGV